MEQPKDAVSFAQLLLTIIDDGRRTSTYKLAALMALIDCATQSVDAQGHAASTIPVRDLAQRVLELYWPQVRPYPVSADQEDVLRQSSQSRARVVHAVVTLRSMVGGSTPHAARLKDPMAFEAALDDIEHTLVTMPLGRLQRPGDVTPAGYQRFLYDDAGFHDGVTPKQVHDRKLAVHLKDDVAGWLVSLSPLLRPVIELHWTREVARKNKVVFKEDRLREFLFGAVRIPLKQLRPGLLDLQQNDCFYCRERLAGGQIDVDHFIPWSKLPNDGLANLVLAHPHCNSSKRDHLAGLSALADWGARDTQHLAAIATTANWPLRREESVRAAFGFYSSLAAGGYVWESPGVYVQLDPTRLHQVLQGMSL